MPKFPTFKTKDEIPAGFAELYEERDGEWHMKAPEKKTDEGPTAEDVDKLQGALEKERKARADAEKNLKDLGSKVSDLEQRAKAAEAGVTDEKLKELRTNIRADIEKEYAGKALAELPESWAARTEAQKALGENRSLKLDSQVKKLAAEHGVRAERLDAWWRQFGDRFDLTSDGKPVLKDKPEIEIAKYISGELKKELPELYVGTKAEGGGAGGIRTTPGDTGMSFEDFSKLSPADKLARAREAEATT